MNHPVITLDPSLISLFKDISDISSLYISQRIEDFKEYMQSKGFSPYMVEGEKNKSHPS